jgi:hypothetical protein
MGIEFFLLLVIVILGIAGFLFFSGSFGAAKAGRAGSDDEDRPAHAYVENPTKEKAFGVDSSDEVRTRAESDPDTEVRT